MMKAIKFYDLKRKQFFMSSNYKLIKKGKRLFAVTTHKGIECWKIIPKSFLKSKNSKIKLKGVN